MTAAVLVHGLLEASDDRRWRGLQKHLDTVKLWIVDELGYMPVTAAFDLAYTVDGPMRNREDLGGMDGFGRVEVPYSVQTAERIINRSF